MDLTFLRKRLTALIFQSFVAEEFKEPDPELAAAYKMLEYHIEKAQAAAKLINGYKKSNIETALAEIGAGTFDFKDHDPVRYIGFLGRARQMLDKQTRINLAVVCCRGA